MIVTLSSPTRTRKRAENCHSSTLDEKLLVGAHDRCIVPLVSPMIPATSVSRSLRGTSLTKASQRVGMQQSLHQCRCVSIWASKLTDAGCLA
jgi:hypothetical protein